MVTNEPDIGVLRRRSRASASATSASAATCSTATAETAATSATGALNAATSAALEAAAAPLKITTAALEVARKLLPARSAALGESSGLSSIAGIEGRALCGKVATPAGSRALSQTLGPASLSPCPCLQTLAAAPVLPDATLSGGACCYAGLSRAACSARKLTPSSPGPGTAAAPFKAPVVPPGCGAGRLAPEALTGCRIAIGDTLAVRRVVLPGVAGDGGAIGIDAVKPIGVDRNVAAAPVGAAPAPQRSGNGDPRAKGEAGGHPGGNAVADGRRKRIWRIARIGPAAIGGRRVVRGHVDDLRIGRSDRDRLVLGHRCHGYRLAGRWSL